MENLITEYKNYALPLKDDKAKWTILKTIISFLNCKGGTIYIGVEDSEGAVIGLALERKERDTFKLYMKQLIEKIYPKVDLNNRQEVFHLIFRSLSSTCLSSKSRSLRENMSSR